MSILFNDPSPPASSLGLSSSNHPIPVKTENENGINNEPSSTTDYANSTSKSGSTEQLPKKNPKLSLNSENTPTNGTECPKRLDDATDSTHAASEDTQESVRTLQQQKPRELAAVLAKKESAKLEEDKVKLMKTSSQLAARMSKQVDVSQSLDHAATRSETTQSEEPIQTEDRRKNEVRGERKRSESTGRRREAFKSSGREVRSNIDVSEPRDLRQSVPATTTTTSSSGPKVKFSLQLPIAQPQAVKIEKISDQEVEEEMRKILYGLSKDLVIDIDKCITPRGTAAKKSHRGEKDEKDKEKKKSIKSPRTEHSSPRSQKPQDDSGTPPENLATSKSGRSVKMRTRASHDAITTQYRRADKTGKSSPTGDRRSSKPSTPRTRTIDKDQKG